MHNLRIIKFRGKRTDTGEWIYGYYLEFSLCDGEDRCSYIKIDGCQPIKVLPETVGQFIGILDKNGGEIYEGDIITANGKYPKLVRFIDEWSCFCLANITNLDENIDTEYWQQVSPGWWGSFEREIKLIGNVVDNPELLKGGKE